MADPNRFCFVHTADLHLDTPFRGLASSAPEVAAVLRDASLDAFDAVVELALAREAAFVVIGGDVYDGPERGLRAQLRFRDGLARLASAGVASFVVHGNHDPVETGWSAISSWPAGVTVFGTSPEVVTVRRGGRVIATVQGVSYATRQTRENLALVLGRPARAAAAGSSAAGGEPFHVGLLHCNVAGAPGGHDDYSPCSLADLRATGLDYLALGHVHQRSVLAEGSGPGDPWVVYPGNLQAHSWRSGELGAKGAYVVQVEDRLVTGLDFVACDRVRFAELSCSVTDCADLGELTDRLLGLADFAVEEAAGRHLVLRAEVCGSAPLHEELGRRGVLGELLSHLRAEAAGAGPLRWWESLRDQSRPITDLEDLRRRGDFAAEMIELAAATGSDRDAAARPAMSLLAPLPRALAARASTIVESYDDLAGLVGRAALRAVDELAGAGSEAGSGTRR